MSDGRVSKDERLAPLIDAALHRYFSRLTRRYLPIVSAIAVLSLIVLILPSKREGADTVASGTANTAGGVNPAGGTNAGPSTGGTPSATGGATGVSDGGSVAESSAQGPAATAGGEAAVPTGGSQSGVARSGVECGPGVLQVPWTPYAPPCVAAFSGDNGGATGQGVTDSTITLVMRHTDDEDALGASIGVPPFEDVFADAQVLVDFFNKHYETYGRTVVLRELHGEGQATTEYSDAGQAGAQADAQTEQDMGAFADASQTITVVFAAALAERGIISMATAYTPEAVYEQYAPYLHGSPLWPTGERWGRATAATVCQRMKDAPAIFAGDPVYQRTNRVFGMTTIAQPSYAAGGNVFEDDVNSCGVQLAYRADYDFNLATSAQQAVAIVAQMKANGVTTLVHAGDPFMYAQLTLAAASQGWHPEYIGVDPGTTARLGDQEEMAHAMTVGTIGATPGATEAHEAGRVFRLASGGAAPRTEGNGAYGVVAVYFNLLQVFAGIQMAGPNLNASSFQTGIGSLPDMSGEFGLWRGAHLYNLTADFVVARWNPTVTNSGDGKAGDWMPCDNGTRYQFDNPQMGSGQLGC